MANVNIKVVPDDLVWIPDYIKEAQASQNPNVGILDGMIVVVVENKAHGGKLQECNGVTMALELIRQNSNQRITLSGVMPIAMVRKTKPEVDILLKRETVRFIELPYSVDRLVDVWMNPSVMEVNALAVDKYNRSKIGTILHGMRVADPKQPQGSREQSMVNDAIAETKKFFPSLVAASDNEILDFLFEASNGRPLVRQGEKLDGVFCDIDGTLIVNGNINEKTLSMLKQYEAEGKQVTLWTDGNKETTSALLATLGVSYPLMAKMDYAGAEVEIALDDFDEFAFNARTKITARTFIQVF